MMVSAKWVKLHSTRLLDTAFTAVWLAVLPASWIFAHLYIGTKTGCFSDVCNVGKAARVEPVHRHLALFYGFLLLSFSVALAATYFPRLRRVLLFKPLGAPSDVCVGELAFFVGTLTLAFVAVPGSAGQFFYDLKSPSSVKNPAAWPWVRVVAEVSTWLSGDAASVLVGIALVPATKYSPVISGVLGLPYTAVNRVHRWTGCAVTVAIAMHTVVALLDEAFTSTPWTVLMFVPPDYTIWGKEKYLYVMGFASAIVFGVASFAAIPVVRRRAFNVFYGLHLLVALAIVLAYFHSALFVLYCIPGLAWWTMDGLVRFSARFRRDIAFFSAKEECGYHTVTMNITRDRSPRPGQFYRVCVPSVSFFEFHPWSVVKSTETSVTFLFHPSRDANQWTRKVATKFSGQNEDVSRVETHPCAVVHLQGPYGKPCRFLAPAANSYRALVFHVAGTGVAPAISVIQSLLQDCGSSVVGSRSKNESNGTLGRSLSAKKRDGRNEELGEKKEQMSESAPVVEKTVRIDSLLNIFLFWTAPSDKCGKLPLLQELLETANISDSSVKLSVHLFDTSSPGRDLAVMSDVAAQVTRGRPHLKALMNKEISPLFALQGETPRSHQKLGVFLCGAKRFIEDSRICVESFERENNSILVDVEAEAFAL
ncbi:hypothetical protein DFJ73DRAFT_846172 [Zopfochytrium polystomum]|nr:hypothetical protein DFJ73DRAFT_846172 [Zopfochytrium polystomum]